MGSDGALGSRTLLPHRHALLLVDSSRKILVSPEIHSSAYLGEGQAWKLQ